MSTSTFQCNRGLETTGSGTAQFYISNSNMVINSIKISACNTTASDSTAKRTLSITLNDGTNTYTSEAIIIPNASSKQDYTFNNIGFKVSQNSTLKITRSVSNSAVKTYWGTANNTILRGGYLSSTQCFDIEIEYTYDVLWELDGENIDYLGQNWGGYPRIIGQKVQEFTYFEKDENGYPYNTSVWKLDEQNEGYPWIVLPLGYRFNPLSVYLKTTDGLIPCSVWLKTANGLQSIRMRVRQDE